MTQDQAKEAIRRVIKRVQEESQQEIPEMPDDFCPLRDLEGFDSMIGLVATDYAGQTVGCEIPSDVNLFVEKNRRLTLAEAAQKLCEAVADQEDPSVE